MKKELLNIVCCPYCKSSLELSSNKMENDEIVNGSLKCLRCNKNYPIVDGIPNFIDK